MINIKKDTPLHDIKRLSPPCRCKACSHPCTMGSGFLVHEDHARLASYLNVSGQELNERYLEPEEKFNTTLWRPKIKKNAYGYGPCVFYDDKKGCTVHEAKPTHCRISMGCRGYAEKLSIWFHVNNFLDPNAPESIRQFATYLTSGGKIIPGASLGDLAPDASIRDDILSYKILTRKDLEKARRLHAQKGKLMPGKTNTRRDVP